MIKWTPNTKILLYLLLKNTKILSYLLLKKEKGKKEKGKIW